MNDLKTEAVAAHLDRLAALATVDAFGGESAAREAERAVRELGHVGIVIDSSRDGRFLNDPSVRPTLEVAASLKVPVLVHPVAGADRRGADPRRRRSRQQLRPRSRQRHGVPLRSPCRNTGRIARPAP